MPKARISNIKDRDVCVRVVIFEQQAVLDRVHAADVGTIGIATPAVGIRVCQRGARADALHKADAPGPRLVRGAHKVALGGAAGRDQPLELEAGDDVGVAGVAVLVQRGGS